MKLGGELMKKQNNDDDKIEIVMNRFVLFSNSHSI